MSDDNNEANDSNDPNDNNPSSEGLIGYAEAARLLGVPRSTLHALVSQRRVPHVRFGARFIRFDLDDLRRWINARRVLLPEDSRRRAVRVGGK